MAEEQGGTINYTDVEKTIAEAYPGGTVCWGVGPPVVLPQAVYSGEEEEGEDDASAETGRHYVQNDPPWKLKLREIVSGREDRRMYPLHERGDLVGVCLIGIPLLVVMLGAFVFITSLFGVVWR